MFLSSQPQHNGSSAVQQSIHASGLCLLSTEQSVVSTREGTAATALLGWWLWGTARYCWCQQAKANKKLTTQMNQACSAVSCIYFCQLSERSETIFKLEEVWELQTCDVDIGIYTGKVGV